MQHVEGRTLAQVKESKELLPLDKIFTMADEICAAMAFAHKGGVIHRDIKPSNLMLTNQGTIKVMDFGIAKLGDSGLTKAGMVLGTPSYLAPEQAAGRRIDHRADIFSVGAVLYEIFTGEKAFAGESTTTIIYKVMNDDPIPPRVIEPSLPASLDAVIRKAIAKDPDQRYQSCDELREALRQCRTNRSASPSASPAKTMPISTSTQPMTAQIQADRGRGNAAPWLAAGAAVLVLGGGFFFWQKTQTSAQQQPASRAEVPNSVPTPPKQSVAAPVESNTATPVKSPESVAIAPQKNANRPRVAAPVHRAAAEPIPAAAPETGGQMWTLQDVPNLMGKADGYAGKGDYQKAIFLYQQILRVDPQSRAAKEALQRALDARNLRR
jgi:serine/threonine-protein kinase